MTINFVQNCNEDINRVFTRNPSLISKISDLKKRSSPQILSSSVFENFSCMSTSFWVHKKISFAQISPCRCPKNSNFSQMFETRDWGVHPQLSNYFPDQSNTTHLHKCSILLSNLGFCLRIALFQVLKGLHVDGDVIVDFKPRNVSIFKHSLLKIDAAAPRLKWLSRTF